MKNRFNLLVLISVLVIKIPEFLWILTLGHHNSIPGLWGYTGTSDWVSYLEPIDNLLANGHYAPDDRMPGYGLAILIPRLLFDRVTALNILIIIQFLTGVASAYLLGRIWYLIFERKWLFALTACAYSVCVAVSVFDAYILTESLSTSFLIIGFYYFLKSKERFSYYYLLLAGTLFCWAIFIRPASGILLVVLAAYLFWLWKGQNPKSIVIGLLMLTGPLMVIDGAWIVQNYKVHGEFRPLISSNFFHGGGKDSTASDLILPQLMTFHQSWGGDIIFWKPGAEIRWFGYHEFSASAKELALEKIEMPSYIYTSKFNRDSLLLVKRMIGCVLDSNMTDSAAHAYAGIVNEKLKIYTESVKSERPLVHYVYGPLMILKRLLFTHGTENIFSKKFSDISRLDKGIKLFEILLNLVILVLGFIGMALTFIKRDESLLFVPAIFVILYMFFVTFIFRSAEVRFMIPTYSFLILCANKTLLVFANLLRRIKKQMT